MPIYSEELLNEIISQNDIIDYVSQYVRLKKNGRDYTGLCPFHNEKSPSFHVNQEKQLFHCFGCGAGGNIVQFVMKSEGLDFVEAIKLMADRAGIPLPEENDAAGDVLYRKKQRIYLMNKTAARFYYETLTKSHDGKPGLEYFAERRISGRTITKYGLGYAPDSFDYLKSHMNENGFKDDELIEAGLCVTKNNKVYDKFRGRVIFPIIDLRGNVIAFGGRIIKNTDTTSDGYKPPKYLNSSDTPVFNKGNNLFSLNFAKKTAEKQCILCEGYMDVISVCQAGVTNITATLGTALTESQARLLMKYTGEILLCYDSDEAGQRATKRAISIINGVGGRCRVMKLKGAKDPDEYIKANGVELFRRVMQDALPSTQFLLSVIKSRYDLDNPDGRIKFVQESASVLAKLQNAIEIDEYVNRISDETEIAKDAIYAELKKLKASVKIKTGPLRTIKTEQSAKRAGDDSKIISAQRRLLSLIIESKKNYRAVKDEFSPEDFSTDALQKLASAVYSAYENGEHIDPALIVSHFSGSDADVVSKIFCNLETYNDENNTVAQLLQSIKSDRLNEKILNEKDAVKLRELLIQRQKLEGKK